MYKLPKRGKGEDPAGRTLTVKAPVGNEMGGTGDTAEKRKRRNINLKPPRNSVKPKKLIFWATDEMGRMKERGGWA